MATLSQLRAQYDEIIGTYDARFAGQSRVTRSLEDLNGILNQLRGLQTELGKLPRSRDRDEVERMAKESVALMEAERKEILKAKSLGPDFEDFDALRSEANLVFAQYHRHFADRSRTTRDLGLLAEMIDDLERIEEEMQELLPRVQGPTGPEKDLATVRENMKMYRGERGEIVEARGMGTPDEQASNLAEIANGQFKLYDDHFAGKSRVTRRPELIQRMIDNLTQVFDRMKTLREQGLRLKYNDDNMKVVEESLATYTSELAEIRKARQGTSFGDLQGMLGGAANEVFEEYKKGFAGQDRRTRNLETLSAICDRLSELGRQMALLGRAEPAELNSRNLQIVTDQRVLFEREYTEIEKVQRPANTV